MSARRSKLEMYMDILAVVNEGEKIPTRIMHGANLSWKPLQDMLDSLVDQGLLEEVEENSDKRTKKMYLITDKGVGTLLHFNKAMDGVQLR
ncbi:MAG: winged helix-turn-helix domain-containing protein [Candidatus Bathyarchaeia archaeon]